MRMFQQMMYRMKRYLGVRVDFYAVTVGAINLSTGAKDITRTKTKLQRAVIVPTHMRNEFVGSKNLKYQAGDKFLITDEISNIDQNDYFVIRTNRFNIIDRWELDFQKGYIFHIRQTQDENPCQVFEESVSSSLSVSTEIVESGTRS